VRGIAQLTASSVKGLKSDSVTITDATGQVLWPQGDGSGAAVGGATAKAAAEARYASELESQVQAMLNRTLGPDKAAVQIHAELDMDKVTRDELTYAKKGVPLTRTTEDEKLRGGGAGAGGVAGTAGNIPQYAQGAGGSGGSSNYSHTTESTDFGVDKTVSKVEQAPGSVERLSVALMTDSSIKDAAAVQAAVAAAVGLDKQRGDTITQAATTFPKVEAPKAGPVPAGMVGPIKYGLVGLGVLLFAFFTWRGLRKREREALPEPAWLREFDQPMRLAELEATATTRELPTLPPRQKDEGLHKLDQLMDREPARVAAQVRQWMNED
jgi:flagellar M-ring protein FliF